ncbi:MAG: GerMN domain-containing protein [Bacilli bacterium]
MIKRMYIKKIIISTSVLFSLFLMYLIPSKEDIIVSLDGDITYVDMEVTKGVIFLLDQNEFIARTKIVLSDNTDIEQKARDLLEVLIVDGEGESKIPSGFKSIIPSDTKILSLDFDNGLIKVNFSSDILEINSKYEEKLIEAIVYTLTNIEGVYQVVLYVDGDILTKLPKTGINLPSTLDRSYGINKQVNIETYKDITGVTIYYISKYNDNYYYVPVTKYVNDDREKIKIIIDELASNQTFNTNLLSFLNSNTELLATEQDLTTLSLLFNKYIFDDLNDKSILEEVIYTISLSVADNYNVEEVIFEVENEEIYKSVLKSIE